MDEDSIFDEDLYNKIKELIEELRI